MQITPMQNEVQEAELVGSLPAPGQMNAGAEPLTLALALSDGKRKNLFEVGEKIVKTLDAAAICPTL
jgi:hypothetical protein